MAPKVPSIPASTLQAGTVFLSAFPTYIRIDISCKHISYESPHELLEFLQEHITALAKDIATTSSPIEVTTWPSLFVVSAADGLTSKETHQDRGCFLLGLNGDIASLQPILSEWQGQLQKKPLFKDYYPPPQLEIHLIPQTHLGTLTPDQWMWPTALLSTSPQIYSAAFPDGEESFAFLASSTQPTTTETGTPTPKKLTPASAIINRLKWDDGFASAEYAIIYEDRHDGLMEIGLDLWTTESTEEHFIPMHRIRSIRATTSGRTVWHREERIDLVSGGV